MISSKRGTSFILPDLSKRRRHGSTMRRSKARAVFPILYLIAVLAIHSTKRTSWIVSASSSHDLPVKPDTDSRDKKKKTTPSASESEMKKHRWWAPWDRQQHNKSISHHGEVVAVEVGKTTDLTSRSGNHSMKEQRNRWWWGRRQSSEHVVEEQPSLSNITDDRNNQLQSTGPVECPHYNLTASSGGSIWRRRKRKANQRGGGNMEMAYRMSVLSTLAYWEFHKDEWPQNCTGFHLISHKSGKPIRLIRKMDMDTMMKLNKCRASRGLGRIKTGLQNLLHEDLEFKIPMRPDRSKTESDSNTREAQIQSCRDRHLQEHAAKDAVEFQYFLYNWFEPTKLGNFHDTDLLISTMHGGETIIISFAGTASPPDTVTIVQTFEPANHSKLFHGGGGGRGGSKKWKFSRTSDASNTTTSVRGALHRGFLNAYSRVERGSVLRLCQNCTDYPVLQKLNQNYGHCTRNSFVGRNELDTVDQETDSESTNITSNQKDDSALVTPIRKRGGCRVKDTNLMKVLQEIVIDALDNGRTVHVNGHSLGGALANLLALDIVVNFPDTPISRLHLWTFGAPQIADDDFLESVMETAPRLVKFLDTTNGANFHRFVTLSDNCEADLVANVAAQTLTPMVQNVHGKAARRLGGIRNQVVHLGDPYYLLTPDQHGDQGETPAQGTEISEVLRNSSTSPTKPAGTSSSTKTSVDAHKTLNYIRGVSRQSSLHPLSTDLPMTLREWLGEIGHESELEPTTI